MENESPDKPLDPKDLPQREVFVKKEVYQHPQPADMSKPLDSKKEDRETVDEGTKPGQTHTSEEEGINEANSTGAAGAFEGFEDQERKE